jgi:hypothetical protein
MAKRPVFLPACDPTHLVSEVSLTLHWHPGFAPMQKEKNILALHSSARLAGLSPLLEISANTEQTVGRQLSAFYLKVQTAGGPIRLECAFEGSKVFEGGGPYRDLYTKDIRDVRRDKRLKSSGPLSGFEYEGATFSLDPLTLFYDWLYLNAIYEHRDWLERLHIYAGFTDIEFNPHRSTNCQARSLVLFLELQRKNLLDEAVRDPIYLQKVLQQFNYHPQLGSELSSNKHLSGSSFHKKRWI